MYKRQSIDSLAVLALVSYLSIGLSWADPGSEAEMRAEATITEAAAARTALARVAGGHIQSAELEREHGKLIWSFDIAKPKSKNIVEVQVDAKTGAVVSEQTETPQVQAAEAAGERKEH